MERDYHEDPVAHCEIGFGECGVNFSEEREALVGQKS